MEQPEDPQDASSSSSSMTSTKGKGKGRQGNKGMPVRTVYKMKFKLQVVNKLHYMEELKRLKEVDSPQQTAVDVLNISQSLVSK